MLNPIIQRPNDLRLLVSRETIPLLKALRQRDVTVGRWRARFCIIGESHQVQIWREDSLYLTEVLACVDFSAAQYDHSYHFNKLDPHYHHMPDYNVSVEFAARPRRRPRCDGRLHFAFPVSNGVLPITEIRWWAADDNLHWWTLHVYPQTSAITYVYSQSALKID